MKKTALRRVSQKQKAELALRRRLKQELIDEFGNRCMTCGSNGDWRGISLSHIIALSKLGKTCRENCILEDGLCHDRYEKKPELRKKEHPELFERLPYLNSDYGLDKGY